MNFCVLGGAWANIGLRTRYPDPQSMLSARAVRSITENPVTLAKVSQHVASMFFETFGVALSSFRVVRWLRLALSVLCVSPSNMTLVVTLAVHYFVHAKALTTLLTRTRFKTECLRVARVCYLLLIRSRPTSRLVPCFSESKCVKESGARRSREVDAWWHDPY